MEKLAAEAAVAALKELTTTGIKAGVAAGGRLWAWIRGKTSGADTATLAAVEAAPAKPSASDKVSGVLKDLLDGNPGLQAALANLLSELQGSPAVSQNATATGDNNNQVQIAGENSQVNIQR